MPAESPGFSAAERRNLELKVRVPSDIFVGIRAMSTRIAGSGGEHLRQVDRYFTVPDGRLKLRTSEVIDGAARAELIAYRRPDTSSSRWSAYRITPLAVEQAETLAQTLAHVLPMLVEVRKHRQVCIAASTRIHLDTVDDLGTFVELETVMDHQQDREAEIEHQAIIDELGLGAFAPEAGSYSDLLLRQRVPDRDDEHPMTGGQNR